MNKRQQRIASIARAAAVIALLLAFASDSAAQNAPQVFKVEPPSWWAGHSINPVRVLVRGKNLAGARVEARGAGLRVAGPVKANANGTYLFVDLAIAPGARPGPRSLRIITRGGSASAAFEITAPLGRRGRFQGIDRDDVIYLLMPDRFANGDRSNDDPPRSRGLLDRSKARYYHGGDLRGVIEKLPYLKDLGVTAIWLNPWYDNNDGLNEIEMPEGKPITDYHGYGAVDFYAVEEHFGDLTTLREMVDRAHALGIKVIQDQVANHTGPYHPWVKDAPTPTWFNGTQANHINETWQTWVLKDKYATPEVMRPILDGWFLNILPDLNQNDPEAARYIIQNTLWWIGVTGLDAIRQDTLPYVPRRFWRDWMAAIKREYPAVNVIGETYDGDPAQVAFFQGGVKRFDGIDSGIDTEFDFPLFYTIREAFAKGGEIKGIPMMVARDYLYPNPSILVPFIGLHDMLRFMSEPGATREGLMLAQTFLMTTRGIPLIYYGDEIAMKGGNDPDNRRDFTGGFPGDERNAFTSEGRTKEEREVFDHLRRVTRLRRELEPLRRGSLVTLGFTEHQYAFARTLGASSVIVVFNNEKKAAEIEFEVTPLRLANGTALGDRLGVSKDLRVESGKLRVSLPARSASIFTMKQGGARKE
jgi:glycosidase